MAQIIILISIKTLFGWILWWHGRLSNENRYYSWHLVFAELMNFYFHLKKESYTEIQLSNHDVFNEFWGFKLSLWPRILNISSDSTWSCSYNLAQTFCGGLRCTVEVSKCAPNTADFVYILRTWLLHYEILLFMIRNYTPSTTYVINLLGLKLFVSLSISDDCFAHKWSCSRAKYCFESAGCAYFDLVWFLTIVSVLIRELH